MEVHKYTDILGKTLAQPVVEGRMVLLVANEQARLPVSAAEAALARYLVAWPVDNRDMPIYNTYPSYARALRYGFEQAANVPFAATVFMTYPGMSDDNTAYAIASGTSALLYDEGEFTVASGQWVYDATVVGGTELEVATGANAGMLQKIASGTAVAICTAVGSDSSLRFRTYGD